MGAPAARQHPSARQHIDLLDCSATVDGHGGEPETRRMRQNKTIQYLTVLSAREERRLLSKYVDYKIQLVTN